jgi:hypothetical protein
MDTRTAFRIRTLDWLERLVQASHKAALERGDMAHGMRAAQLEMILNSKQVAIVMGTVRPYGE